MVYNITGSCPRCGAPIYEVREGWDGLDGEPSKIIQNQPPAAYFTCECRHTLPKLIEGELEQPRSVREADKHVVDELRESARARRGEE